jgi:acyl-coenzyme A synthetase/AMP-(fatty) acid ligase
MTRAPFDSDRAHARAQAGLEGPAERPMLRELAGARRVVHTRGEIAALARAVAEALARKVAPASFPGADVATAGVYMRSPAHLVACVLGCWQARRLPVLVDPSSKSELEQLAVRCPGIPLLAAPDHVPPRGSLVIEAFGAGAALPETGAASLRAPAPDEWAVAFFTSGSEGRAKLVPKRARQLYAHAAAASAMLAVPEGCRALSFVPLFHILGFSYGFMAPLMASGESVVLADPLPHALKDALLACEPALVVASAVHYRFLNAVLAPEDRVPDAIYISSGAPLPAREREAFERTTGRTIVELYGSTETAGIAWRRGDGAFKPYPGVELAIEDERVCVRSPWADPESLDAFVATHDAGELDGDGLRLLGRAGSIVKVGGKRFSALEVEQALKSQRGVADAACVAYERNGEPALAAFVVPEPGAALAAADLRAGLASQLASFKVPRTLLVVPALPRRKLGKLNYAELKRLAERD